MKKTLFNRAVGISTQQFCRVSGVRCDKQSAGDAAKTMDSAFQTVQKANMSTLIQQGKEDFAEQVKIYEECVKQYEECVKIYKQAVRMYDWIDTNVGNARNLKTFLSCGFSDVKNLQQMSCC